MDSEPVITADVLVDCELGGRSVKAGEHIAFNAACRWVHLVIDLPVDNLGPIMAADLAGKIRLNVSPSERAQLAAAVGLEVPSLAVPRRPWRTRPPYLDLVP